MEKYHQAGANDDHKPPQQTANKFQPPMTIWKQINETDSWAINEIRVGRIGDNDWCIEAKLANGRIARMFKMMSQPDPQDEPMLLRELIRKDKRDRVKEWLNRLWLRLTRCYGCHCEDS